VNHLPAARQQIDQPLTTVGFSNSASFEFTKRAAQAVAHSTLVPEQFRVSVINKRTRQFEENPNAIPNCIIALNMAQRMGADPLMVMQNLYVVEGRPSWSAQFVIASINACGRYSPLRFDLSPEGEPRVITYEASKWVKGTKVFEEATCTIKDRTCRAWAIEKETGERLDGPEVSMAMAEAEGWLGKNGSKWQTMPEMMLRYRAASFFGRLYAPELLMGLSTQEEAAEVVDFERGNDGAYMVISSNDEEASEPPILTEPPKEKPTPAKQPKPKPAPAKPAQAQAQAQPTTWLIYGSDGKVGFSLNTPQDWAATFMDWVENQDDAEELAAILDKNRPIADKAMHHLDAATNDAISAAVKAKQAALSDADTPAPHDPETGEVYDDGDGDDDGDGLNFSE
jgi:hypothetical protein